MFVVQDDEGKGKRGRDRGHGWGKRGHGMSLLAQMILCRNSGKR